MAQNSEQFYVQADLITDGHRVVDGILAFHQGRVDYAGDASGFTPEPGAAQLNVPDGAIILPGLIDVHTHGAFGGDFPSVDEAAARTAIDFIHRSGTTSLLASMVTAAPEVLRRGVELYAGMVSEGLIAGIHLEGPFLSSARCGAQNPDFLIPFDAELTEELIELGRGTITSMTYAPELPGAADLVELLSSHGIIPSVGHTDADCPTTAESLNLAKQSLIATGFDGVTERPSVTHLFNGMPPMHHRAPGPVAACLRVAAQGNAVVELIADNTHLDPETVLTVFDLVGMENITLITDSMAAAGLDDGEYLLGPSKVRVHRGVARLVTTDSIAGGTSTLLQVVQRAHAAGVPLEAAVYSATATPARLLGLADEIGDLRPGLRADLVVLNPDLTLNAVYRQGKQLPPNPAPTA